MTVLDCYWHISSPAVKEDEPKEEEPKEEPDQELPEETPEKKLPEETSKQELPKSPEMEDIIFTGLLEENDMSRIDSVENAINLACEANGISVDSLSDFDDWIQKK